MQYPISSSQSSVEHNGIKMDENVVKVDQKMLQKVPIRLHKARASSRNLLEQCWINFKAFLHSLRIQKGCCFVLSFRMFSAVGI